MVGDCWRRVLRRSAGWRRKAERVPVERPARKWNARVGGGQSGGLGGERGGLEIGDGGGV